MRNLKNPWVIILTVIIIGILYHLSTFTKSVVTKRIETRDFEMSMLQVPEDIKKATSLCSAGAKAENDLAFGFFFNTTRLIDHLCKQHKVQWFLWGDVSLRLHQFGTRLLKSANDQIQGKGTATFEIFTASEDVKDVESFMQAILTELKKYRFLECAAKPNQVAPVVCHSWTKMEIHIHAPAVIDMKMNQLTLADESLLVKYAYKLDRILPLQFASYNGLQVPVPKDSVYVFSHMVPFKGYRQPDVLEYKYAQGCKLVLHNVPSDIDEENVLTCGENLHKAGFANLYESCYGSKPEEATAQLEHLVKSQSGENVVRLEDFRDVVVLQRGKGSYHLDQPNGRIRANGTPYWSQYEQDQFVEKYFHNKTNGFFIEIGGYDGEKFSNSLYLEKFRDWDGLLVEAIPKIFNVLESRNRKCNFINACISNDDEGLVFTMADVLSSSNKQMPQKHMSRIQNKVPTAGKHDINVEVYVHCKTLMSILDKLNVHKIDFFSLDVEGTELFLLNSIDWGKVDIELFSIETDHHRQDIIDFMALKGYDRIKKLVGDDVFSKRRS